MKLCRQDDKIFFIHSIYTLSRRLIREIKLNALVKKKNGCNLSITQVKFSLNNI